MPSIKANAETPKETVKVVQVGTSGGIPAIQATLGNAGEVGTYSIVITNPKTNAIYSQSLNSNGKPVTFAITNFTENGTYPYTLQVNGLELLEGGVNLVSTKRTPTFVAQLSGTDLTVDVSGGTDYAGQKIFFKSGSYSNSLVLAGDTMQRAFADAKNLDSKMTFSTEKGNLVTVDIKKVGDKAKPSTPTTKPSGGTTGGGTTSNGGKTPVASLPAPSTGGGNTTSGGAINSGGTGDGGWTTDGTVSTGGSVPTLTNTTNASTGKTMTISLNQKTFKLEQTIVATVKVNNPAHANRSLTVRLGADDNSTVALMDLDNKGQGSSTFKVLVPQPSTKTITASAYTISGDLLDTTTVKYAISNETAGSKTKDDGDFGAEVPAAEYVSLDLTNLTNQKATLAWYKARNLSKYATKLKVINTTTNDEHSYAVFMPDGDSKINLNLVYDGPGIYTWELYSGGRRVAQAPYSTPLEVDGATAVSQNGLPVLQGLPNKDLYQTPLDGTNPNAVNGASIGEEIGGTPADDVSGYEFEEPFNAEAQESHKKRNMLIGLAVFILLGAGVAGFFIYRKKKNEEEEEQESKFVEYKADGEEENSSGDTSQFEEVD